MDHALAERLTATPAGEFIPWVRGHGNPAPGQTIDVRFADGQTVDAIASNHLDWSLSAQVAGWRPAA